MGSMQWQLGTVGNHPSICSSTQGNQENPVLRWPVTGPSGSQDLPDHRTFRITGPSGLQDLLEILATVLLLVAYRLFIRDCFTLLGY
jgi:hypothetical protein